MKIRQCIFVIVLFLLLVSGIEAVWAGCLPSHVQLPISGAQRDTVFDLDGNVITEAEIEENMTKLPRIGCVIGGGLVSAVVGLGVGYFAPHVGLFVVIVGPVTSYQLGKRWEREQAIIRIIQHRQQQKKHAFGEQNITDGFYFRLLKGTF